MTLTSTQIETLVRNVFVMVHVGRACASDRQSDHPAGVRAARMPTLTEAYDPLVGAVGGYGASNSATSPSASPSAPTRMTRDGYCVTVSSRDRGLSMLFLLSDVGADDAPTRIEVGSQHNLPRCLAPHGDTGVDMFELCEAMAADGTLDSPTRRPYVPTRRP